MDILEPERTPWADNARIKREGVAIFCRVKHRGCMDWLEAIASAVPESRRIEVTVVARYLGMQGEPTDYALVLIAPELYHPH